MLPNLSKLGKRVSRDTLEDRLGAKHILPWPHDRAAAIVFPSIRVKYPQQEVTPFSCLPVSWHKETKRQEAATLKVHEFFFLCPHGNVPPLGTRFSEPRDPRTVGIGTINSPKVSLGVMVSGAAPTSTPCLLGFCILLLGHIIISKQGAYFILEHDVPPSLKWCFSCTFERLFLHSISSFHQYIGSKECDKTRRFCDYVPIVLLWSRTLGLM